MESSIPFVTDAVGGFAVTEGVLRLDAQGLTLEFLTKDSVVGLIRSDVRQVRLDLDDIEQVEHLVHPFGARLRIRARSLQAIADVPGQDGPEVVLKHKARHGAAVRSLSHELNRRLGERQS